MELVNGHQVIVYKLMLNSLSFVSAGNLQIISIAAIVFSFFGSVLLLLSQIKSINSNHIIIPTTIILVCNYKQMQNYFTIISAQWMVGIFVIGLYYWLKQLDKNRFRQTLIILCCFIGPMVTGLGLILPIIEMIENICVRIFKLSNEEDKKYLSANFLFNLFILISYTMLILFYREEVSGSKKSLDSFFLMNFILNPIESISFLFTIVGSVFVPSSRYDFILPSIAGAVFIFIMMVLIYLNWERVDLRDIYLNKNCLMGGVVYIILLFAFRFEDSAESVLSSNLIVAAPRYVSGSLIFILGILALVAKIIKNDEIIFKTLCLILMISILFSGLKTGIEWHSTRFKQSQEVIKCIALRDTTHSVFTSPCFKVVLAQSQVPTQEFLKLRYEQFFGD